MKTGKIRKWISDAGYGFITPDGSGSDVFLHFRNIKTRQRPHSGDAVSFEIGVNERSGKDEAINVTILAGGRTL